MNSYIGTVVRAKGRNVCFFHPTYSNHAMTFPTSTSIGKVIRMAPALHGVQPLASTARAYMSLSASPRRRSRMVSFEDSTFRMERCVRPIRGYAFMPQRLVGMLDRRVQGLPRVAVHHGYDVGKQGNVAHRPPPTVCVIRLHRPRAGWCSSSIHRRHSRARHS